MVNEFYNRVGGDRIASRQIDELIGIVRGIAADGTLNKTEVKFLQKWLAANLSICDQPLLKCLYERINDALCDGLLDPDESVALLETLNSFSSRDFELGEVLKSTTLPLCDPAPKLIFLVAITVSPAHSITGNESVVNRPLLNAEAAARASPKRPMCSLLVFTQLNRGSTRHLETKFLKRSSGATLGSQFR